MEVVEAVTEEVHHVVEAVLVVSFLVSVRSTGKAFS